MRQVLEEAQLPSHYASADDPILRDQVWFAHEWELARRLARSTDHEGPAVLVLDEIQKAPGSSETVKRLWDEDTANRLPLHVVLLGSAPLLVQRGLSESLAGRFEIIPITHWSFPEMRDAFGWNLEQCIYYGGYPGSAALIAEPDRWRRYILDSLVETTISRDIMLMQRVDKPVLLRRLFELGCQYSGQILSFTKILGQLQEPGNSLTLAHYLDLLKGSGLLEGLQKHAGQRVRQRASSPKFQVHNNSLITSQSGLSLQRVWQDPDRWGRLVESAVGAHLVNSSRRCLVNVHYWLHRNQEVDFVLVRDEEVVAIEVKTGRKQTSLPGLAAFAAQFPVRRTLLVGERGIALEEFLSVEADAWF